MKTTPKTIARLRWLAAGGSEFGVAVSLTPEEVTAVCDDLESLRGLCKGLRELHTWEVLAGRGSGDRPAGMSLGLPLGIARVVRLDSIDQLLNGIEDDTQDTETVDP